MPTPNANVLTFPPLPDKMGLKPLKVRIAGRRRRPLALRVLQKTMNRRCVCASPFHQPARRSAISFPITPQALSKERIEVLPGHAFK